MMMMMMMMMFLFFFLEIMLLADSNGLQLHNGVPARPKVTADH